MRHSFYLAWKYAAHHSWRSLLITAGLALSLYIPLTLAGLLSLFQSEMRSRSEATPLVLGKRGSRVDLVLNSLYFQGTSPEPVFMSDLDRINGMSLSTNVPLNLSHTAQGFPVVGTSLDYFDIRQLRIRTGKTLTLLGDCLVGATVAESLNLKPGDRLMSDPRHLFDLAGAYPLNMRVRGILERSNSPDDRAVFTDLKTAWVIEGLGHGHEDLEKGENTDVLLESNESHKVANASLKTYNEINEQNRHTFHFHGENSSLPLTAILVFPDNQKSGVLIRGRYLDENSPVQLVVSRDVVGDIMQQVVKVKKFFDIGNGFVALTNLLFLVLILLLSVRLREQEMQTLFHLGCSRGTIGGLLAAEWVLLLLASFLIGGFLAILTLSMAPNIILRLATG